MSAWYVACRTADRIFDRTASHDLTYAWSQIFFCNLKEEEGFMKRPRNKTVLKFLTVFLSTSFFVLLFLSTPGFSASAKTAFAPRICDQPAGARTRLIQSFGQRSTTLVGPVKSKEAFIALFSQDKFLKNFHEILVQACLENYESDIVNAIKSGEIKETTLVSGTELRWAAGRRSGRVKVSGPSRYIGTRPVEVFQFAVRLGDTDYIFAVPKVCGNLMLVEATTVPPPTPPPPPQEVPPPPAPAPAPTCTVTITTVDIHHGNTVEVRSDVAGTLEMQLDGAAITGVQIPPKLNANEPVTLKFTKVGHYTARLTAENGAVCDAATDIVRVKPESGPFLSAYFGKERRVRAEFLNGRCDPMVGIDGGYSFFPSRNFEIAPTFGVGINTRDTDFTSLYTELEFNGHFGKALVGTGIGWWDFNHSNTDRASLLGQFGIDLSSPGHEHIIWLTQGRLFFSDFDDIQNNYMVWTGLRFEFR
jgi:hypothetical protein